MGFAGFGVLASIGFYIVGCVMDIYEVTNTRGILVEIIDLYSVISVGQAIPESSIDPTDVGILYIQAMWYFLVVAMPIWCSFLFGLLFFVSWTQKWMERIFVMAEIAFAWSCAEVLLISTIFAVLQMPTFGDGLIEADCAACFTVDSRILKEFAYLAVGSTLNVMVNVWLYRKAHHVVYSD